MNDLFELALIFLKALEKDKNYFSRFYEKLQIFMFG